MKIDIQFTNQEEHDAFVNGIARAFKIVSDVPKTKKTYKYTMELETHDKGGRKSKFEATDITTMKLMKDTGSSYNQIAKHFDTTKTTIIKYLCHKGKE